MKAFVLEVTKKRTLLGIKKKKRDGRESDQRNRSHKSVKPPKWRLKSKHRKVAKGRQVGEGIVEIGLKRGRRGTKGRTRVRRQWPRKTEENSEMSQGKVFGGKTLETQKGIVVLGSS